ncbi:MAG: peptidase [Pseudomonadota bacterium]
MAEAARDPGPEEVLALARRWLGTPYRHQASCLGAGADCLGLIRGVWRGLYGAEPEVPPPYSPDWGDISGEEPLMHAALRHLHAVDTASPGDVLLFRVMACGPAKHLGILSAAGEQARLIHAYSGHSVCETSLTPTWARRIAGRFRFPPRGS